MWKVKKLDSWNIELITPKNENKKFKYWSKELTYDWTRKRYVYTPVEDYLYKEVTENLFEYRYKFGIGFSAYLLFNYYNKFDINSVNILNEHDPINIKLDNLYDFQNTDINKLLEFKRGIFQCYTGYGKTEIIASLIDWINKNTKDRVLVLTSSSVSLDTIKSRLSNKYNIDTCYFDYDSNINVINVNGFPRSNMMDENNPYWSTVDWIIADEVERVATNTCNFLLELCINYKRIYGFSATADKTSADRVRLDEGNVNVVQRNKHIINNFGFSSVFKLPNDFIIHEVNVKTSIFQNVLEIKDPNSEYSEIIYNIFTDDEFCKGLKKIILGEKGIFIPMFRLQVIDYWIENYFNDEGFICINLCGRGYEYYLSGKFIKYLSIEEINEMVNDDVIDVIVGTKSAFNSLDLPNLKKAMVLHSKLASIVIQAIGRVTRKKEFMLINLIPNRFVRVYSNDLKSRTKLIHNYYKECKFITTEKFESDYGIY